MSAVKKTVDMKILQELVPLNTLSHARFEKISKKIVIEEVRAGSYLFRIDERDKQTVYLLGGEITLLDGERGLSDTIKADSSKGRFPIADVQPRILSARAVKKCVVARVDSSLLDAYLSWDQANNAEAVAIGADENADWMTRMLQSRAFEKIPPEKIQQLLLKMDAVEFKAGATVIRQGEPGDCFYTIKTGRCAVTRKDTSHAEEQVLAELSDGDYFGEEALVRDVKRNATVSMLTDGVLMRLAKQEFVELLQKPLIRYLDYEKAAVMIDEGAIWLDVRTVDEYDSSALEDSVNIPLSTVRGEMPELVFNVVYVIYCDTGQRSASAAFILSHKGFDVYVLQDGLQAVPGNVPSPAEDNVQTGPQDAADVAGIEQQITVLHDQKQQMESGLAGAHEQQASLELQLDELKRLHEQDKQRLARNADEYEHSVMALQDDTRRLETSVSEQAEEINRLLTDSQAAAEALERKTQAWDEERARLMSGSEETQQHVAELQEQHGQAQEKSRLDKSRMQEELDGLASEADSQLKSKEIECSELQQRQSSLSGDLEGTRKECDSLQQELSVAAENSADQQQKIDELNTQLVNVTGSVDEQLVGLQAQLGARQQQFEEVEQQSADQLEQLSKTQDEVAGLEAAEEQLKQEVTVLRQNKEELEQALEQRDEREGVMQQENEQELVKAHEDLVHKTDIEQELQGRIEELRGQLEQTSSDLQDKKQKLESGQAAAHEQQALLELKMDELKQAHEQEQQRLASSVAELERAATALQGEARRQERNTSKQEEKIDNLQADKQAAVEAQDRQIQEWDEDRARLISENAETRLHVAELQEQLEQAGERSARDKSIMQENMDEVVSKTNKKIERKEIECVEIKQSQSRLLEDLEVVRKECDDLQKKLGAAKDNDASQQQKIDALNARVMSVTGSADEQLQGLQVQLEDGQVQLEETEQKAAGTLEQLHRMQDEMAGMKVAEAGREQEITTLRQQKEELQQVLVQRDEEDAVMQQEHGQALVKAHEDLTRKNDTERELQGQVDRLRKKLEQTKSKHQDECEVVQAEIDSVREDLHAERSTRSTERAEMAARQRELKEKLAAIATEHEANLTNHTGAIEQAKIAGRKEEQAQMQQMCEIQRETEIQIEKLKSELSQAHDETATLVKREKSRRHEEHGLADERKQEYKSSLDQLRTQTEQMVLERDAALKDQAAMREKINSLRVEVEVARGLMGGGQGQVEDPVKLRRELDEARKNVEIAVRLRVETESACTRLKEERDVLQKQVSNKLNLGESLNVQSPGSDENQAGRSVYTVKPARATTVPPVTSKVQTASTGSGSRLVRVMGLGVIVIAGLVYGLESFVDSPLAFVTQLQTGSEKSVSAVPAPDDEASPVAIADKPRIPPPVVKSTRSVAPAPKVVKPEPPVIKQSRLAATGTFRDRLQEDGFAPLMVELPAAGFMMGSQGYSLNSSEGPQHKVSMRRFAISKYEVTFADYDRFARATGARLPHDETWGRGDRPVVNVSWKDAQAYVRWLSAKTGHTYRLPAESQWEYAARAGSATTTPWEDDAEGVPANCFNCGSEWDTSSTAPVGSFSANYFGLHDMGGNVQEWTEDCYRAGYAGAPDDGTAVLIPECTQQSVRGGAYTSPLTSLRTTSRAQYDQDTRLDNLGFRIVRIY